MQPNLTEKFDLFFWSGFSCHRADSFHYQFSVVSLPVKYLRISLISTRLTKAHCNDLVARIAARVLNWTSKALSFTGWLQFINSVVTSMQLYWCSVLMLPMVVVHEVEKDCRSFL